MYYKRKPNDYGSFIMADLAEENAQEDPVEAQLLGQRLDDEMAALRDELPAEEADQERDKHISTRVSEAERELLNRSAEEAGVSRSSFLRKVALGTRVRAQADWDVLAALRGIRLELDDALEALPDGAASEACRDKIEAARNHADEGFHALKEHLTEE